MPNTRDASGIGEVASPRTVTRRDALRLLIGAGVAGLATLAHPLHAAAVTQEEIDAAQQKSDEAQAQLDDIANQVSSLNEQMSSTVSQIEEVNGQIEQKQADIDSKQAEIDSKQGEIDQKQQEVAQKQKKLGNRMASAYKSGAQTALDLILASTSFEELTSNIYYLDKISEADKAMIDEVKTLKAQLEQEKQELEAQKAELETQKAELETQQADLEALKQTQQSQLADLQAKQQEAADLVSQLDSQVQDLISQRNAELLAAQQEAARIAAERAAASSSNSSSNSSSSNTNYSKATGAAVAVVNSCYSTPTVGAGYCAAWVTYVFRNAGIGNFGGNACDMYYAYCSSSNTSAIKPGMIIAVPSEPYSAAARIYGHIGIYIGGGIVMHSASGSKRSQSLSSWISEFGVISTPRWGWLGGVVLS